jgi:hypothetical protein
VDRPTPDQVLAGFVAPALDVLARPGEVTSVRAWDSDRFVMVEVQFGTERFVSYAWQTDAPTTTPWLGKFASELQDFIAESRFAWGTWREYPAEWGGV